MKNLVLKYLFQGVESLRQSMSILATHVQSFLTELKLILLLILMLTIVIVPKDGQAWTYQDSAWELGFLSMQAVNWKLVDNNIKKASQYDSYGMTDRPQSSDISTYFLSSMIIHPIVSVGLDQLEDKRWLRGWQQTTFGLAVGVGIYGLTLGVNLK